MNTNLQKVLILTIGTILIGISAYCGYHAFDLSKKRAIIKQEYSVLNNITFGLLSVNAWREHVTTILDNRIEDFNFTPAEKDTLTKEVEQVLHALVDEAGEMIDKKPKKLSGKIKRLAVKTFIKEDEVHEKVPQFAETIVNEINKKKHRSRLKYLAHSKLQEAGSITYDSTNDLKQINAIMKKYAVNDVASFNKKTEFMRQDLLDETYQYTYIMLGILAVFLAAWFLLIKQKHLHRTLFVLSLILALVVLFTGLTTPMIEIDARIKEMSFTLIGEKISFNDQVIFYQSKSIVDVVSVLLETGKIDSVVVGVLILAFSILFPVGKLLTTQIYLLSKGRLRNTKFIQYFAFKSGKWSMADVMVVAIFMAYIGFKGILDSQLTAMNVKTESLASVSTNQTTLQPGFILFVGFVLFSLIISEILHRTLPPEVEKVK